MQPLSYQSTGVNYDVLDKFKLACQRAAGKTVDLLAAHGVSEPAGIRGESAYLVETPEEYLAHVEEGLGTKNLVADALLALQPAKGAEGYFNIGIDTVGAIVNDLLTVGALPMVVAMHAAVGLSPCFFNQPPPHPPPPSLPSPLRPAPPSLSPRLPPLAGIFYEFGVGWFPSRFPSLPSARRGPHPTSVIPAQAGTQLRSTLHGSPPARG